MNESDIIARWEADEPQFRAWADFVVHKICSGLEPLVAPQSLKEFIKVPAEPRLKDTKSLVDKALHRGKRYADPYGDITDKAGVRFVVLLTSDIKKVEEVICGTPEWECSKDRDYEEERLSRPLEFSYQSVHYIVRAKQDTDVDGVIVPAGSPCEVQVRTLLQHAHSELTHDTIYKPKKTAAPKVHRTVAKSMALIEAADDFFEEVVTNLDKASKGEREAIAALVRIYREKVGAEPEKAKSNLLILDAFADKLGDGFAQRIEAFIASKPFISGQVATRASDQHLFRQAAILFVYFLAGTAPSDTKERWPLTPNELRTIYSDLGLNIDGY